ncbi:hypothetical protein L7D45_21885 [Brucella pseudogrignonensis]|uniref:hypothetical protein n=1 Tax=Brucella pseudogrignonensis TaxID=419475 RepID=UPI00190A6FC1|nr:hypothetical protein [Brucella pseudogrignonensis]MBK0022900.1 hypothetical protein [Ochrobactrum sp. S45]MBK0044915.1 hypothetical protein [Ochrobactrum sp. S46]UKK95958.1 hypothetical protein L7D45_21885 [Brucella pseudogrignonensis]
MVERIIRLPAEASKVSPNDANINTIRFAHSNDHDARLRTKAHNRPKPPETHWVYLTLRQNVPESGFNGSVCAAKSTPFSDLPVHARFKGTNVSDFELGLKSNPIERNRLGLLLSIIETPGGVKGCFLATLFKKHANDRSAATREPAGSSI